MLVEKFRAVLAFPFLAFGCAMLIVSEWIGGGRTDKDEKHTYRPTADELEKIDGR